MCQDAKVTLVPENAGAVRLGTAAGRWVIWGMVLGSAVTFVNATVVNVALPAIADDLDASTSGVQWIANTYLLPLAALILFAGSAGDRLGRRNVFLAGALVLTIASVICAVAPNLEMLLAGRVLQGIGAAAMTPASLAIIDASFPEEERGRAIATWASGSALASAVGPFFGGLLVDGLGWRWVFVLGVPLALGAIWATLRHVTDDRVADGHFGGLDFPGAATSALAVTGLVVALVQGPASGWGSALTVGAIAAAVVGAIGFAVVERRSPEPLVPSSLFRSLQFTGANLMTLFVYFGIGGTFFFTAIVFQTILGWSAAAAGAALLPASAVLIALSPRVGKLAGRVGPRYFTSGGALLIGVASLLLSRLDAGDSWFTAVLPAALLLGLGFAGMVPTLTAAVLASVPPKDVGVGSAINNATARTSSLLALASLPGIVGKDFASSYPDALLICAGAMVAGAVVAFFSIGRCVDTHTTQSPNPLAGCAQISLPRHRATAA